MHEVLVNRLGGLSLPRKSVVRLTDRPDMTLDVYRGRKTTMQQQQQMPFTVITIFIDNSIEPRFLPAKQDSFRSEQNLVSAGKTRLIAVLFPSRVFCLIPEITWTSPISLSEKGFSIGIQHNGYFRKQTSL